MSSRLELLKKLGNKLKSKMIEIFKKYFTNNNQTDYGIKKSAQSAVFDDKKEIETISGLELLKSVENELKLDEEISNKLNKGIRLNADDEYKVEVKIISKFKTMIGNPKPAYEFKERLLKSFEASDDLNDRIDYYLSCLKNIVINWDVH